MIQPGFSDRGAGRLQVIQVTSSRASVERLEGVASIEIPWISYELLNIRLVME